MASQKSVQLSQLWQRGFREFRSICNVLVHGNMNFEWTHNCQIRPMNCLFRDYDYSLFALCEISLRLSLLRPAHYAYVNNKNLLYSDTINANIQHQSYGLSFKHINIIMQLIILHLKSFPIKNYTPYKINYEYFPMSKPQLSNLF